MKRETSYFLSLVLISVFLIQTSMIINTEAEIDNESITKSIIEQSVQQSKRKIVLHFDSLRDYDNFVESNDVKLEFRNLKMALIEGYYDKYIVQALNPSVSSAFDITNSKMYRIDPPEVIEYIVNTQNIKRTVETKDLLNVQPLWNLGYKGDNIVFYDVDTGINVDHVDFAGRIMNESKSFVNTLYGWNVNDSTIFDGQGHGTHTAGIGAGAGNGNPLYIGMAPEAEILVAKISNLRSAPLEPFLAAYDYGITMGVDVINLSWGGGDSEGMDLHELAAEETIEHGIIFITSAGNEGSGGLHTVGRPGTAPNTISVAGTSITGGFYQVSSKGPSADGYAKPDIAAPGQEIMSCGIEGPLDYVSKSGTSMAAPHIAGIATVLIDALQDLGIPYDPHVIKAALMKGSDPGTQSNLVLGAGIPDLENVLDLIQSAPTNASGVPALIWAIPSFPPIAYNSLPQGFHGEMFLQSVSSTPYEDLAPVLTGNITNIVTLNATTWTGPGTKNYFIAFDVADDEAVGFYEGYVTFETAGGVVASTYIKTNVIEGKGKILYTKLFSGLSSNNFLGTYNPVMKDLLKDGFAVNEFKRWNITGEMNIITEDLLNDYQTVWIADPWNYDYEDYYDTESIYTYHISPDFMTEVNLIQQYVIDGGSLLMNIQGIWDAYYAGYPMLLEGYNTTLATVLLDPFGIAINNETFEMDSPERAQISTPHVITDGVTYIDHYGTYLTTSGNAQIIAKHNYKGVCAVSSNANGGRVVVVTNNVFMDSIGYEDGYSINTQNKIFSQNIFKWLTVHNKIMGSYVQDETGADFSVLSLNPASVLTATLAINSNTNPVILTDEGGGLYSYRLDFSTEAIYTFRVTSSDDEYIGVILHDLTAPSVDTGGWNNNTIPTSARLDFRISDTITDIVASYVKLNGEAVSTSGTGKAREFSLFVSSLDQDINILEIYARDFAGNVLEIILVIPLVEPETSEPSESNGAFTPLVLLLSTFGLAAVVFFRRRK